MTTHVPALLSALSATHFRLMTTREKKTKSDKHMRQARIKKSLGLNWARGHNYNNVSAQAQTKRAQTRIRSGLVFWAWSELLTAPQLGSVSCSHSSLYQRAELNPVCDRQCCNHLQLDSEAELAQREFQQKSRKHIVQPSLFQPEQHQI